jgi:hypothetical protein
VSRLNPTQDEKVKVSAISALIIVPRANASYLLLPYRGRRRYRNRYRVWRAAHFRVTAPRDVIDSDTDTDADPGKGSESKRGNPLDAFALLSSQLDLSGTPPPLQHPERLCINDRNCCRRQHQRQAPPARRQLRPSAFILFGPMLLRIVSQRRMGPVSPCRPPLSCAHPTRMPQSTRSRFVAPAALSENC